MSSDTSYPTIIISDEVREYLDKILHAQGEEAWYTSQIELDLTDYNGAIKSVINQLYFWKALAEGSLAPHTEFDKEIKVKEKQDLKPIIVPAFTRDPNEELYCVECSTLLVKNSHRFWCPKGCNYEVLIINNSSPTTIKEETT